MDNADRKVKIMSTFFFSILNGSQDDEYSADNYNFRKVQRWTKRESLPNNCNPVFDLETLFVPICIYNKYHRICAVCHN